MAPLCNFFYVLFSVISRTNQSAVGFSAVLFSYAVLDSYHTTETTRKLWFITVPAKLYPWALLLIIQVMMPNVSFIGHLSGIVVAVLMVTGYLGVLLPSSDFYLALEQSRVFSALTKQPNYISWRDRDVSTTATGGTSSSSSSLTNVFGGLQWILGHIWNVLVTLFYIFGIRLPSTLPTLWASRPARSSGVELSDGVPGSSLNAGASRSYRLLSQRESPEDEFVEVEIGGGGNVDVKDPASAPKTMTL